MRFCRVELGVRHCLEPVPYPVFHAVVVRTAINRRESGGLS